MSALVCPLHWPLCAAATLLLLVGGGSAHAEESKDVPYEYHPAPPGGGNTAPPAAAAAAGPVAVQFSETRSVYPAGRIWEVPCGDEHLLRSEDGAAAVQIEFRNTGKAATELWWLDYQGKRVSYGVLAPGKMVSMGTFATHPWVLAGKGGKCRVILVPRDPARALLKP